MVAGVDTAIGLSFPGVGSLPRDDLGLRPND